MAPVDVLAMSKHGGYYTIEQPTYVDMNQILSPQHGSTTFQMFPHLAEQ